MEAEALGGGGGRRVASCGCCVALNNVAKKNNSWLFFILWILLKQCGRQGQGSGLGVGGSDEVGQEGSVGTGGHRAREEDTS